MRRGSAAESGEVGDGGVTEQEQNQRNYHRVRRDRNAEETEKRKDNAESQRYAGVRREERDKHHSNKINGAEGGRKK
jgi:hypothetical protein